MKFPIITVSLLIASRCRAFLNVATKGYIRPRYMAQHLVDDATPTDDNSGADNGSNHLEHTTYVARRQDVSPVVSETTTLVQFNIPRTLYGYSCQLGFRAGNRYRSRRTDSVLLPSDSLLIYHTGITDLASQAYGNAREGLLWPMRYDAQTMRFNAASESNDGSENKPGPYPCVPGPVVIEAAPVRSSPNASVISVWQESLANDGSDLVWSAGEPPAGWVILVSFP
ncbi:hypothetical protein F5X96DRAFT_641061 [Biscogniauxia mediterranea]|nr:hypothetical protein F5X96DRAFT_641061 [Biscogniauxia mediterranea]